MSELTYCCTLRKKFLLGIIGEDPDVAMPIEAVDAIDWDSRDSRGRPVIIIRYCPFCGVEIGKGPRRIV